MQQQQQQKQQFICRVSLQNSCVPANTKLSAAQIPCINPYPANVENRVT
jgi:hypothetical protein